ncbi:MAG: hypothetical protein WA810_09685 [Maribacter sp.]
MKALINLIISISLAVLFIAPSIVIVVLEDSSMNIEFIKGEKNSDEEKELNENDAFLTTKIKSFSALERNELHLSLSYGWYVGVYDTTTLDIFLPPPKHTALSC